MTLLDYFRIGYVAFEPVLLSTFIIFLILGTAYKILGKPKGFTNGQFIFVFALLGSVIGIIMGNSREPSVSAVLPATLTIITALAGYAFTKDSLSALRPVVPYCLIAVIASSYYCLNIGANIRSASSDRNKMDFVKWKLHYEKVDLEIEKDTKLKNLGIKPAKD